MSIRPRGPSWQIEVYYSKALPGFQRVRQTFKGTKAAAESREAEILQALEVYGKYPIQKGDAKVADTKRGTLRIAAKLAWETHYKELAHGDKAYASVMVDIEFLEQRGRYSFEDVSSEDIDALIKWHQTVRGNTNNTINHHISYLSTVNTVALERDPPLTKKQLALKRLPVKVQEKWWLTPEDLERCTRWLEGRQDPLFADVIRMVAFQGFRVEEALRLEPRHFTGLDTEEPWVRVTGTKTQGSQGTIAVFDAALPTVRRSIERAKSHNWTHLFPYTEKQARERWNEVREFLGVSHIKTATLRALRRTFAHYANLAGMPTRTLQKTLRHSSISTTEGYLTLTGADEVGQARRYMRVDVKEAAIVAPANDLTDVLAAYRAAGATPKEIAELIKEMRA